MKKEEKVKIKATKVKAGKVQHMVVGREYEVTKETAKILKAKKLAE